MQDSTILPETYVKVEQDLPLKRSAAAVASSSVPTAAAAAAQSSAATAMHVDSTTGAYTNTQQCVLIFCMAV